MKFKGRIPHGFEHRERRNELAVELCREIDSWKRSLGSLPQRWKRNENLYRNNPAEVQAQVIPGEEAAPMPLWTQRADRIVGTVFAGITSLSPYVQCVADDPSRTEIADAVEQDLHFLAIKSDIDLPLYQALRIAVNTNLAAIRARCDPVAGRFILEEAHPGDLVAYPADLPNLADLKTVGHRFERMAFDIRAQIAAGRYLEARLTPGDADIHERAGRDDEFDRTERTYGASPEDERVELYEVVTRRERMGEVQMLRCVVAYGSQELLDIEEWPYAAFPYFEIRYDREYARFLPSGSPAQNVQGPQIAYTRLINTVIQGGEMASMPPIVLQGGTLTDTKLTHYRAGTVFEVPASVQASLLPITFNGQYLVEMIPLMERIADGVTRISQIGLGQAYTGHRTATEISGILQGQALGEQIYVRFVSRSIERLYEYLFELYVKHFSSFKRRWGAALQVRSSQELEGLSLRFEVTGRSATNNPASLVEKLQLLHGMAQTERSQLDPGRVERAIVQALQLPGGAKLFRDEDLEGRFAGLVEEALTHGLTPTMISRAAEAIIQRTAEAGANTPDP